MESSISQEELDWSLSEGRREYSCLKEQFNAPTELPRARQRQPTPQPEDRDLRRARLAPRPPARPQLEIGVGVLTLGEDVEEPPRLGLRLEGRMTEKQVYDLSCPTPCGESAYAYQLSRQDCRPVAVGGARECDYALDGSRRFNSS